MNEINEKTVKTKNKNIGGWLLLLTPIGIALLVLANMFPTITELFYSTKIYVFFMDFIAIITNWVPFSIAEMALLFVPPALIIWIASVIIYAEKEERKYKIKRILLYSASVVSCFFFAFVLLEGINYNRISFSKYCGLTISTSTTEELSGLCNELITSANSLRYRMDEDETGVSKLSFQSVYETADEVTVAFQKLEEIYPVLSGSTITAKPLIFSNLMSYAQLTGIFSPYTMEANINANSPDYSIPATMCHEMAHVRGFAKEDEANFIAYLACKQSYDSQIQYSGVMLALIHSMNELYSADYNMFLENYSRYSDAVKRDMQANAEYWQKYQGPVAEVSNKVNDTYLKLNNQANGTQSYGRMVDLLLADYKNRH